MEDFIPAKKPDVRRHHGAPADYDFKNVVVVASVWLLFYVAMLGGPLDNRGRDLLANIADLLAWN